MLRRLYSLLLFPAIPLILLRLLFRGLRQRGYWRNVAERWGRFATVPLNRSVWVHAVSVGEMRAAQPLIQRLQSAFPGCPIVVTCMTVTGREVARELYAAGVTCVYLPYDFFRLQQQFIAHFRPEILLIMETEIWPNLLAACNDRKVPAVLVNGRLSEKSRRGYARLAPVRALIHDALQSLQAVAAQSADDAARLASLGARNIVVTGNIKFDAPVDAALVARGRRWRESVGAGQGDRFRVLLAASTREGEEALLLDAYRKAFPPGRRDHLLLIMVPRHPQRFDAVQQLIQAAGLSVHRRSGGETPDAKIEVWLGDSMGEMAAYIAMCDVAFIGGSLLPFGGQNLIEACAQGKPVIMGPSTFNFSEAARQAIDAGGMRQVTDAAAAMAVATVLLDDDGSRLAMSRAALAFAQKHAGATEETMGLITPLLAQLPSKP